MTPISRCSIQSSSPPVHPARRCHDGRAFACAFALGSLFFLAFFLKSLVSGEYIAPSDSLDFGLPAFLSAPMVWSDGMYSGYPIAADPQALTWYPVLIASRALGLHGWNMFMIFPYVLASAGTYLLVRRMSGSNLAGTLSGLAYGLSGVMLGHIGHFNQVHAAAWVPLAFYGLQLVREGLYRGGALMTAAAVAMTWLAGHPQVVVYMMYVSAATVLGSLLIDRPARPVIRTRLAWSALGLTLGFGLAAITILPMVELGDLSRRAASKWDVYISKPLPAWQFITLVIPNAFGGFWIDGEYPVPYFGAGGPAEMTGYVGLLPFMLAVAAPFVLTRFRREAGLWMLVALVAALLCLGAATPIGTLFFYAPGYASFRVPSRHLFVLTFCLAVASGLAFAELVERRDRRPFVTAAAATLLASALAFAVFAWLTPAVRDLVRHSRPYLTWSIAWPAALAAGLLGCMALRRTLGAMPSRAMLLAPAALLALHVGDMIMFHYRWPGTRFEYAEVPQEQIELHPKMRTLRDELVRRGERVLAVDGSKNQFLLPNLTRPWDVPAASGTGSLGIERYLDVLGMGGPGDVADETLSTGHRGADLFAIRYALVPQTAPLAEKLRGQPERWSPVEDLRYYESDPDTHYTLFRNARALRRAWCAPEVARTSSEEALFAIRSGHFPDGRPFDPSVVALVEPGALGDGWGQRSSGTSSVVWNRVDGGHRYLVTTDSPCLLVLSEVHYPWWRSSVGASRAEVVRVNHTMVGIPVPRGTHVVSLWLEPTTLWVGAGISVTCLVVSALLAFPGRRLRERVVLATDAA